MEITRIGDHILDEDEGYESDQLRDDAKEHGVPELFEPMEPAHPEKISNYLPADGSIDAGLFVLEMITPYGET